MVFLFVLFLFFVIDVFMKSVSSMLGSCQKKLTADTLMYACVVIICTVVGPQPKNDTVKLEEAYRYSKKH